MARKSDDGRWKCKFGRFVDEYGVSSLAERLEIHETAIYHWFDGSTAPRFSTAQQIRSLAGESGFRLSIDDIYQTRRKSRV